LEGKDVKDLLLNVGSGGGAAPAAASAGGAAAGGAAPEATKEEEKPEEKEVSHLQRLCICWAAANANRRSLMRTWASDCSTKQPNFFRVIFHSLHSTYSFLYFLGMRASKISMGFGFIGFRCT